MIPHRKPAQSRSGSEGARDTSAAYRRLRARILRQEPLCRYCVANGRIVPASVLDHVVALSLNGTNDPGNLAPACQPCNSEKGALEQRYIRRGYDPAYAVHDPELGEWIRIGMRTG